MAKADSAFSPGGFRTPYRPKPLRNARGETVDKLPAFSKAYLERRCLVLLNGYYEWEHRMGFSKPIPWHFHYNDDGLMVFAGLWQNFEGEERYTFLTTEPNDMVKRINHDRMPSLILASRVMAEVVELVDSAPEQLEAPCSRSRLTLWKCGL